MDKKVLIASPQKAFADLLRHSLSENRKYSLKTAVNLDELQTLTDQTVFDLVILDAESTQDPLTEGVIKFRADNKDLKLVVFPPGNENDHPSVRNIGVNAFLRKPFYLPQLQETLATVLNPPKLVHDNGHNKEEKDQDALRYQHLLNLIYADSPAVSLLLIKDNAAYAAVGDLEESSPQEVAAMIMQHWNPERRRDVVRFKRMDEGGKDYLFYATAINDDLILLVIFERTISLTSARLQTLSVIRQLKNPPAIWLESVPQVDEEETSSSEPIVVPLDMEEPDDVLTMDDLVNMNDMESLGSMDEADMIKLEELLASMPNPDPNAASETVAPDPLAGSWLKADPDPVPEKPKSIEEAPEPQVQGIDIEERSLADEPAVDFEALIKMANEQTKDNDDENSGTAPFILTPETEEETTVLEVEPAEPELQKTSTETAEKDNDLTFPWDEEQNSDFAADLESINVEAILKEDAADGLDQTVSETLEKADSFAELAALIEEKNELKKSPFSKFEDSEAVDLPIEIEENKPKPAAEEEVQPQESLPKPHTEGIITEKALENLIAEKAKGLIPNMEATQVIRPLSAKKRSIPADYPDIDEMEDTAPRNLKPKPEPKLEPNAAGLSSLNYTFVLLPRFPEQYLTGELAEKLGVWLPQLCVAYGWRLDRISIRPQYVQWTLQVSPTVSPGYIVRVLREETSRRIYNFNTDLQENNPSKDFWAPGYLVMSGYLPPSRQMLTDFIQQTRHRQGLDSQDE